MSGRRLIQRVARKGTDPGRSGPKASALVSCSSATTAISASACRIMSPASFARLVAIGYEWAATIKADVFQRSLLTAPAESLSRTLLK